MFFRLLRKARSNSKGFTLVELMVVVAIIGILVAIAIPQFGVATQGAERAAVEANLRTIESAIMMYRADQGAFPTLYTQLEGTGRPLVDWPTGPGTARYGLHIVPGQTPRAEVWGTMVGGVNLGAGTGNYILETLPWR